MKTRSKYILLLFVGMIVLLLGGIFFTAQQEKEGPITAEAASEYWALPSVCPSCGEAPDMYGSLNFTNQSGCTYTYVHTFNRGGGRHTGTITAHNIVAVEGRDPTCTSQGWYSYNRCSRCGKLASSQTMIPALGHDYGDWFVATPATCTQNGAEQRKCSRCSARETRKIEATGHTWDSGTVTVSATCQRTGTRKYECTACGETKTETIAKRSHNYNIYLSRIEPTCTASGRTAGYECQWCYANTCSTIPALGHDLEYYDGQPATCTEAGWNNYETCSRCEYTTYREIAATGHTPGAAATCTTPQTCTECGAILVEALGHKTVSHLGQDPTCTAEGWKPYETCENCDYTTYEIIPALGHSFTNYVSDNNATCTEDGTETAKCDRCDVTDTRTDEGSALGHDWAEKWTTDGTSHWHECNRCDEINDKANHSGGEATCIALAKCEICGVEYGDFAEHVYVENAEEQYLVSAATCTAKATYYKSCSVCGEAGEEVFEYGEPLGHEYGEPEWTWEGYTSATATFTCTRGCGDKQTATASGISITNVVTTPAECEKEGLRTYTARVTFGGEEYTATTTETLAALGHDLEHHEAKPATCTEIGWEAYDTCTRCDYTTYVEIEALGHNWAEEWTTDGTSHWHECSRCDEINDKANHSGGEATCTNPAECEVCGAEYGEALGHTEGEAVRENEVSASCTAAGSYDEVVYCSVCGEELSRGEKVIEALGHDLEHHEAKPATCTEIGWNAYDTCTRCDYTTYVEIEALGHDWAEEWTTDGTSHWHECSRCDEINDKANHSGGEATCTNPAECEVCGAEYGEALGHTEGEAVRENEVPASCTAAGSYDEVVYCSVCGEELSREEKVIDALGHSFTNYVSDNNATCTEDGTETAKCDRCEVTDTRMDEGSALGHDWAKEWTTDGTSHWHECSRCDEINDKANHSGGEATCTNPAECEVCGAEYGEALDHDFEHHEAKPATCTEIGWEAYDTCTRCDYTTYVEIAAKGHTFGPDATCTEDQVCLECGEVISAATGHIPGSDATCTENQTCSVCGEILTPALGHSFTSYISDNNATCTEDGTETAKCDRCEVTDTRTDEGSALGHDLEHHEAKPATCTEIGWNAYDTCTRCDYTTYVEIEALGHDWTEEWTTDGTSHWHECSRCDEINDKANHSGGTATCVTPAECEVCGAEYGDLAEHVYVENAEEQYLVSAATCTAKATYYKSCSVCGEAGKEIFEYGEPLGHEYGEPEWTWEGYTSATATFTCTRGCGDKQTVTASGSSITNVVTTPAECETEGLRTYTAKVMFGGEEYVTTTTETIEALGHDLKHHEAKPATCTEIGWNAYDTCTRCDYTTYVDIEALGHDWAKEWTTDGTAHWHECSRCDEINDKANHSGGEATCTNPAECEVCGAEYGEALGHTEGEAVRENEVPASCTAAGSYDEVVYCSVCGEELSREEKVIDALGHDLEHHEAKPATCTEIGWDAYDTCSRCDYTTYVEIDALGHTESEAVRENEVPASCTAAGSYDEVVYCSVCGEELSREGKVIDALGHSFTSYVSDNNATCTEDGTETAKCDRCEVTDTRTDEGSALGHNWAEEWTTDGTAHWHECSRCDEINDKASHSGGEATCTSPAECEVCGAEYGESLGHDFEHHEAKPATCTETGWEAYDTCTRCDYTTYVEIPAKGHAEGEVVRENEVAASCTAAGSYDEVIYCSVCGEELSREEKVIDALGHSFTSYVSDNNATCTEDGTETAKCDRCEVTDTRTDEGSALGHDWAEEWTTDGTSHWHECSRCDEINDKANHSGGTATCIALAKCEICGVEYGDLAEHNFVDGYCTVCGIIDGAALDNDKHDAKTDLDDVAQDAKDEIDASDLPDEVKEDLKDKVDEVINGAKDEVDGSTDFDDVDQAIEDAKDEIADAILDAEKDDAKSDLDEIAQNAKDEIDASDLPDDVKDDLKGKVDEIVTDAKGEIDGETSKEEVDQTVEDAQKEIEDAILNAEKDDAKSDLDEIAQSAKDEIDASDLPDDVKDELKNKVDEIVSNAKTEIDGETSKEEVDQTVEDAQKEIEDAILDAEKDDAKSDLDEIAQDAKDEIDASDLPDDVKDELKNKVDEIVSNAKGEIDGASSKEEIDTSFSEAETAIEEVNREALESAKEDVLSELEELAQSVKEEIDGSNLPDEEKNELKGKADELLGSVQDKLAKTTTPDEVYKIGDTVASELEAIRDGAIESAKEGVLTELEELAQSLKDEIDGSDLSDEAKTELKDKADEILENVKTEIKEKTTFEEVYELGETAESEIAFVQEEAIATAREEAVAALETYAENAKNGIASSDLSPEEQADHSGQIDAEVEATKEEITAAADFEAIANALAEAMAEIDRIQAIGHIAGPAATCTAPQVCTVCGKELAPALGHDLEHHEAQPATCIEIGWNAYDTCSRCDYTTYEEIPALGHTEGAPVRENEAAATCTAAGSYDEVIYCSVCGEELSREEKTIEALGHTEGAPVRENEAAATCTAAGSYDEVVYCSVCGEELSRAGMTIEALGHDIVKHEGQAATCTQNGWNDYETCSRCDYTTYREIAATGHTPGTAATCTSAQRCTVCGTTLTPARGHNFVDGYCTVCGVIDSSALEIDKDDAKTDLDDAAQDAKDEIDASDLPDDVKDDLKDKVDEIVDGAKDEVDGSTDFDDVDQAIEDAKDEIEDAILDAEKDDAKSDLDEIAQGAKDEVDGSDLPDDVKDDLKGKVDEIVNDAKAEIDGETSKEEVDQTVEDAQKETEDAILNAEKDDAKSDLDEIAQSAKDEIDASDLPDDVKDELKGKVDAAVEEAKEAIDNATSKEEVENIVNDTREDIDDLLKGGLDNELAEKKDTAISDLTEIAQGAKDEIAGSDVSDEEKDELKGKVDEIVNEAKAEIEAATAPEEIDEILAEAENEIAAVTEGLKAGQLNTSTLWPWIIVAIVISAALSTLFAWRHVKKVQGKGEAVGAKSVVTIAVATILIFVVVIGITLLIFAMV